MKKSPHPFFSIVIPALNEEKYLPLLLRDLTKQSLQDFEVIVIDGKSEDKTVQMAERFASKLKLTILTSKERNVSLQRNMGGEKAKGNWIIFMDADNRLPNYFLTGIQYQLLKNPTVSSFTAWAFLKASSQLEKLIEVSINYGLELSESMGKPYALGALIGCHKDVFKKVKFNEQMKILEDHLFVKDICAAGFTFTVFKEPRFYYSSRRIKKEGNLKMIRIFINNQTKYILGGDFSKPYSNKNYPMLGGGYYNTEASRNTFVNWVTTVENSLKNASKKQLEQARARLRSLIDFEM